MFVVYTRSYVLLWRPWCGAAAWIWAQGQALGVVSSQQISQHYTMFAVSKPVNKDCGIKVGYYFYVKCQNIAYNLFLGKEILI